MSLLVVVLVVLLVVLLVAAVVVARWWTWRPVVRQRAMVQLDTGLTLEGVVMERRGPLLVLADVTVHVSGEQQSPADGQAVVDRRRVVWMQVV